VHIGAAAKRVPRVDNSLFWIINISQWALPSAIGTELAVQGSVKTKLSLPVAILLGVFAPFALPAGAAEAVAGAVAMIGDLHIMEFAVSANALTIVF